MTTQTAPPRRGSPPRLRPPARPGRPPAAGAGVAERRVDPRIAARRIAVRRDAGRRRLRRLAGLAAAVVVLAGLALLTRTAALDVDHIRVRGVERLGADEVTELVTGAGAGRGEPLVRVDPAAVERALAARPEVAEVDASRRWPGTVVVDIVERVPVAVVRTADGRAGLVAADGVVVDVVADAGGLPELEGGEAVDEPGAVVDADAQLAVAAALPAELRGAVAAVTAGTAEDEVALRLARGGIARLGTAADIDAKLVAVATMIEQADLTCLAVLDVRVPSAPAVTSDAACGG